MAKLEILALKRNDVGSALALRKEYMSQEDWGDDDESMIIQLQDQPDELLAGIKAQDVALKKALPRQEAEAPKPVAAGAGKASGKKLGSGGRVRYSYPGEKGGTKKPTTGKPQQQDEEEDPQPKNQPNVQPDKPQQEPVEVPAQPGSPTQQPGDVRPPSDQKQQLQHSVNIGELVAALGVSREKLQAIVAKFTTSPELKGRSGFINFMSTHAKHFIEEHGLDGDYFGLVFDVLTGARPEAVPPTAQQPGTPKQTGA